MKELKISTSERLEAIACLILVILPCIVGGLCLVSPEFATLTARFIDVYGLRVIGGCLIGIGIALSVLIIATIFERR